MRAALHSFLLVVACLLIPTFGRPSGNPVLGQLTNGERLKRGLPPKTPVRRFDPTKRVTGTDPSSSTTPAVPAVIKVYDESNPSSPQFLGYLSTITVVGSGLYTYSASLANAVVVSVQLGNLVPGNILLTTGKQDGYPNLGFSGPENTIGSGSPAIVYLAAANPTGDTSGGPQDSSTQSVTNGSSEPTETGVWKLVDSTTLQIAPQWVNPGGGQPATYLIYFTSLNYIVITGDPAAVTSDFGANNIPVNLYLDTVDVP